MSIDPDRLAELEEERRFLLRSLGDLEREHAAGDVDDVDYRELKDGYTVRAAATLRTIEEGRGTLPTKPPTDWRRRGVWAAATVGLIALVSWALVASSSERATGQQATGLDPRDAAQVALAEARQLPPADAIDKYAEVLRTEPDNVEALTYRGWLLALSARQLAGTEQADQIVPTLQEALASLTRAADLDPTYPDPSCFLGIIEFNFLQQAAEAKPWVDRCLANNPPADVRGLVEGLQAEVAAALAGGSSPTAPASVP
jgi:tetratricopeptide (TPR) repeat protein